MRADIRQLSRQLRDCLASAKNGEEIVIQDHGVPIARILPVQHGPERDQECQLVASGTLKMPEEEGGMDWNEFFLAPAGNVAHDVAVQAAIDGRGDR